MDAHTDGLRPANALSLVECYDLVIDASDNPATRYLVRLQQRQPRHLIPGEAVAATNLPDVVGRGGGGCISENWEERGGEGVHLWVWVWVHV